MRLHIGELQAKMTRLVILEAYVFAYIKHDPKTSFRGLRKLALGITDADT